MQKERFKIPAAVYLLLIKERNILLLRRFNTGYEDGNYSLPAGHINDNETMTLAMVREAQEETGIKIDPRDLKVVHCMHRKAVEQRVEFFFTVEKWVGDPTIQEVDKCDELQWYPMDNLPANVIPYIRHVLKNFQAGVFYSEFGW